MHDMTEALDDEALGHLHRSQLRHAADIVAAEIEQHQMLGALLRISEQLRLQRLVFFVGGAASARPASGRIVTVPSRNRTRISGLEPTTAKPPKSRKNRNGAGLIRRNARYSANGGSANGTEKRWLGTIWKASPARDVLLRRHHRRQELLLGEVRRRRAAAAGNATGGAGCGSGRSNAALGFVQPHLRRLPCGVGGHRRHADRPARPRSVRHSRCRRSRTAWDGSAARPGRRARRGSSAGSRSIRRTMS